MLGKNQPQREQTILMGDMNASVANYNIGYEGAMGAHGLGDMNSNEERLVDIYAQIASSLTHWRFSTKKCMKPLGFSTNHTTETKVDHLFL